MQTSPTYPAIVGKFQASRQLPTSPAIPAPSSPCHCRLLCMQVAESRQRILDEARQQNSEIREFSENKGKRSLAMTNLLSVSWKSRAVVGRLMCPIFLSPCLCLFARAGRGHMVCGAEYQMFMCTMHVPRICICFDLRMYVCRGAGVESEAAGRIVMSSNQFSHPHRLCYLRSMSPLQPKNATRFPLVAGKSLAGKQVRLPKNMKNNVCLTVCWMRQIAQASTHRCLVMSEGEGDAAEKF